MLATVGRVNGGGDPHLGSIETEAVGGRARIRKR